MNFTFFDLIFGGSVIYLYLSKIAARGGVLPYYRFRYKAKKCSFVLTFLLVLSESEVRFDSLKDRDLKIFYEKQVEDIIQTKKAAYVAAFFV